MKLTSALAIAAAAFGQSVPAARSQGIASLAFQDLYAKFPVPSASKSVFSGGRAQQTLSDQCVDETDMIFNDTAYLEAAGETAVICTTSDKRYFTEDGVLVRIFSLSGCDDSLLRDYCDANYQTTEWPNLTVTCAVDGITLMDYYYDIIDCSGVSCPAELDLQDYFAYFDPDLNETTCDPIRLIEEGEELPLEPPPLGPETLSQQCQDEINAFSADFELVSLFYNISENCPDGGADYMYEDNVISILDWRDPNCFDVPASAFSDACESKNCTAFVAPNFKFQCPQPQPPGTVIYVYGYVAPIGKSCPQDPAEWKASDATWILSTNLVLCDSIILEDGEEPPPRPADEATTKGAKKNKAAKKAKSSKDPRKRNKKAK